MPCDGVIFCSLNFSIPDYNYDQNNTKAADGTNFSFVINTQSPIQTTSEENDRQHKLHATLDEGTVSAILCFSVLVFVCSCLVLLATHWTNAGRGATFVFVRSLCLSDTLMSIYGVSKMTMLLFLDQLSINFFLPESLFFTASFASTMSLLFLNLDCFLKLTKPLKYGQAFTDKDTVITMMLLMWNAAFIVGFLPLIGWNREDNTVLFFSFYPWHYLFLNGCISLVCVCVCAGCMVSLKRSRTFCDVDCDYFSSRMSEVREYKYLHRTIMVDSGMWLCCYLPFFLYIALTCPQCLLSDFPYRDSAIIYFIPIFMVKSLLSSVLQASRTLQTCAFVSKLISQTSIMNYLRERRREKGHQPNDSGLAVISFTNPLCRYESMHNNQQNRVVHNQYERHHRFSEVEFRELIQVSDFYSSISGSSTSLVGITNCTFPQRRDSMQVVHSRSQETTAL